MQDKVSIIIVNYNGQNFLPACLESLSNINYPKFEIIIIDNNSTDDSAEWLDNQKKYNFKLIKNRNNLGFSVANNLAAFKATGDYLFFLNNDTRVDKNILHYLVKKIKDNPSIGVCGCTMKSYDGATNWHSGVGIDIFGYPIVSKQAFYAEGSALMIRRDLFEKLSCFDESYFMFHEDIDLCWRARLLGYDVAVAPDAIFYHYVGGAAGGRTKKDKYTSTYFRRYLAERNNIKTLIKNYKALTLLLVIPAYALINCAEMFVFLLTFNFKTVACYLKAWKWNIDHIDEALRSRRVIQAQRKVTDRQILKQMYFGSGKFLILKKIGLPKFK